jgi:hypothetical protein
MRKIRRFARRLVALWHAADSAARTAGVQWYRAARAMARKLGRMHGCSAATAAGVIAALSPRLTWSYNVIAAEAVLAKAERVPGVFRANLAKARAIAAGARPLTVLSGPKVRAFYRALCGDSSAAVVDVWTARAAGVDPQGLSPQLYAQVARALKLGADEVGTTTSAFQAVAWVAVRGRA